MPIFNYKGYNPEGKEISGSVEASSLNEALFKVKAEGIFPSDIKDAVGRVKKNFLQRPDSLFLQNFTRQLSILLAAGVPVSDALQSISSENRGYYRDILVSIKDSISAGAALHRALQDFKNIFPDFYINMIQTGEQSGNLDKVTLRLADYIETQNSIRSRIRTAMAYPILMMGVCIIVLSFLFTFVVPKIVKIFADTKSALPFVTHVLIFISNVFVNYWWAIILIVAALFFTFKKLIKKHRLSYDRLLLKLPGNLLQSLYYSRVARTLSFLLDGGIPMLKALSISSRSTGNKHLEDMILKAEEKVSEGKSLSASLEGFPPVFIQLISVGEKSGRLVDSLKKAADSYDQEFQRRINRAVAIIEPIMILSMGLIVCFIVLAVLLPIFQLNQLIK
jgi:general secretion pathway protein F